MGVANFTRQNRVKIATPLQYKYEGYLSQKSQPTMSYSSALAYLQVPEHARLLLGGWALNHFQVSL